MWGKIERQRDGKERGGGNVEVTDGKKTLGRDFWVVKSSGVCRRVASWRCWSREGCI